MTECAACEHDEMMHYKLGPCEKQMPNGICGCDSYYQGIDEEDPNFNYRFESEGEPPF